MTWPHFSFEVNLGQLLVTGAVTALGWGLRKVYKAAIGAVKHVTQFIERIHDNDDLLEATTTVVDDHTRVMLKHGLLKAPIVRLHRLRRSTDPAMFTEQDLS